MEWHTWGAPADVSQVARLGFKVAFSHPSQDLTFGCGLKLFMKNLVKQKQ